MIALGGRQPWVVRVAGRAHFMSSKNGIHAAVRRVSTSACCATEEPLTSLRGRQRSVRVEERTAYERPVPADVVHPPVVGHRLLWVG
jgi:hypothetical protein